jgi:carboxylesterase
MNIRAHEDDVSSLANAELVACWGNGPTQMLVIPDSYDVVVLDRKREAAIRSIVSFLTLDHEQAAAVAHQRKAI